MILFALLFRRRTASVPSLRGHVGWGAVERLRPLLSADRPDSLQIRRHRGRRHLRASAASSMRRPHTLQSRQDRAFRLHQRTPLGTLENPIHDRFADTLMYWCEAQLDNQGEGDFGGGGSRCYRYASVAVGAIVTGPPVPP